VGIYGILSCFVRERAREIGIRLAVGAQASSIVRLVALRGMLLGIYGVGIGTVVALAATGTVSGLLFGITARDPATFGLAAVLLLVVAFAGCAVPVWRAMRADPIRTLRYE
jgi:ABC-type antimicrobial peptide transport system permease subunit